MNAPADFAPQLQPGPCRRPCWRRSRSDSAPAARPPRAVREQHGRDESPFDAPPPEAVVFCESTDDVGVAVALAHAHARAGDPVRHRLVARRAICSRCRAA